MLRFIDQIGKEITLRNYPEWIISVVPSQTELLYDLGLNEEVTGITKFCELPAAWFESKQKVGGTKKLDISKIRELNPDLVIANKEENTKEDIRLIETFCPVWTSDIGSLEDALQMIRELGQMTNRMSRATTIINQIEETFSSINRSGKQLRVAYFIWNRPMMVAANHTFINNMIQVCRWKNVFDHLDRYPETDVENTLLLNPELILLSSEPYPFSEKHLEQFRSLFPQCKVKLVDGQMFSWYGSRLLYAAKYFNQLIESLNNVQ